jgi:hypothetical protein
MQNSRTIVAGVAAAVLVTDARAIAAGHAFVGLFPQGPAVTVRPVDRPDVPANLICRSPAMQRTRNPPGDMRLISRGCDA